MLRVKIDASQLRILERKIVSFIYSETFRIGPPIIQENIDKRSHKGLMASGESLGGYSERHAKVRARLGLQTSKKDLRMNQTTPPLLDSIDFKRTSREGGLISVDAFHVKTAEGLTAQGSDFLKTNEGDSILITNKLASGLQRVRA